MAKFYNVIGFGESVEISPGVYDDEITERPYYGDVIRDSRQFKEGDKVNNDISLSNSLSIVSDTYANDNIFAIRYVKLTGTYWEVTDVEVQSPRLILRLGGIYNGPKGTAPVSP